MFFRHCPISMGEVCNFWSIFSRHQHFFLQILFVHQFQHQPDVLKFKRRWKLMFLIWSCVLKSVKIYQLNPTSWQVYVFVVDCITIRYIYCSVTLLKIHQKCSQDKISCPSISRKSCPQMGYSRKNPGIFRFIHLLLLEILGKTSFQTWKFWKIV